MIGHCRSKYVPEQTYNYVAINGNVRLFQDDFSIIITQHMFDTLYEDINNIQNIS